MPHKKGGSRVYRWLTVLLPHLVLLVIDGVAADVDGVEIRGHARAARSRCGRCGQESARVHSRYVRTLADAVIAGRPTAIRFTARRFFCNNPDCAAGTFAEQVPDLTARYARRTALLRGAVISIALALAGRPGARLAAALGMTISRSSLLRLIRGLPDPPVPVVAVLGVDDFAFRRRHDYGTILVDMTDGHPVDLLADREAGTFTAWLKAHPGTEVICRDRAGAYALGGRDGAPDAIQVADRWHLWHNLAQAAEKSVAAHRECLRAPAPDAQDPAVAVLDPPPPQPDPLPLELLEGRLAARTRERYTAVQSRLRERQSIGAIARELRLTRHTVRRFARAQGIDELLAKTGSRGVLLDSFKEHLHRRLSDGITDAAALTDEIRAVGYRGSAQTVRRYLHPFRATRTAPPPVPDPPKVRRLSGWIMTDPDHLDPNDQAQLDDARARCPHLDALAGHVTEFAKILTGLHGERLDDWIDKVNADPLPALRSFATGLKNDHAAVVNGLTMTHNSGGVEGNVNRIKTIKRQMYGRAKFDLLRKRVLPAK
jgi:transposase